MFSRLKSLVLHPVSRRVIRVARIGVISVGIYSIGRTTGSLDVLKDPEKYETDATKQILEKQNAGGLDLNDIHYCVVGRGHALPKELLFRSIACTIHQRDGLGEATVPASALNDGHVLEQQIKRVQRVATRLLNTASDLIRDELEEREHGHLKPQEIHPKLRIPEFMFDDNDNEDLRATLRYLEMPDWKFIFIDSPEVNAFVHGLSPRTIYVTSGLVSMSGDTDSSLAMVLSHEVAHTMQHHNERGLTFKGMMMLGQLVMLSLIDPVGITTLLAEIGIASAFPLFDLSHDRSLEKEADALGFSIAARSCYPPKDLLQFFRRLEHMEVNGDCGFPGQEGIQTPESGNYIPNSWLKYIRTHPFADERLQQLEEHLDEAEMLYEMAGCNKSQTYMDWFLSSFSRFKFEPTLKRSGLPPGINTDALEEYEVERSRQSQLDRINGFLNRWMKPKNSEKQTD